MSVIFDGYRDTYGNTVEQAIGFSGLRHDFFLKAKADLLRRIVDERGLGQAGRRVRALDVGCGVGSLHHHLTGAFSSLEGCDVSAEAISRAREEHPDVIYKQCASGRLPYADATFDLVFTSCVLHHVPPDDWRSFLRELRRVLRPGGITCVIEHNPWNPLTRLAVLRCPFDEDAVLLRASKVKGLLEELKFSEVRSEHILLLPFAGRLAQSVERAFSAVPIGAQYACSGRA